MKNYIKILKDVSGASAAEYALILAIVGAGIAIAAYGLGQSVKGAMDDAKAEIDAGGAPASPTPTPTPTP